MFVFQTVKCFYKFRLSLCYTRGENFEAFVNWINTKDEQYP